MENTLQSLIFSADDHYLSDADLSRFQQEVRAISDRIEAYEYIRDRELAIMQPAVDYLSEEFPTTDAKLLERAVIHWLSILRYSAMAMLQNDVSILRDRLLAWIPDAVAAYQIQEIELSLYRYLQSQLKGNLSPEQLAMLQPYLEEAQTVLASAQKPLQPTA